jgi:hypothetical protein
LLVTKLGIVGKLEPINEPQAALPRIAVGELVAFLSHARRALSVSAGVARSEETARSRPQIVGGELPLRGASVGIEPHAAARHGQIELVAEDDVNKRYTVREKNGKMTTIYWNPQKNAPEVVAGDFSAIPTAPVAPAEAPPETERK